MVFLNWLKNLKSNGKEARILVLGLDNSGKTTILKRLSLEDVTETSPTQGFNVKNIVKNDTTLNLWDLGGQRAIRVYWNQYYENVGALVYVIDSTDEERMEETRTELEKILNDCDLQQDIPVLVLANKQDLMNSLSVQEISSALHLADIQNRPVHIQPCSAKSGEGIEEGFDFLVPYLNKEKTFPCNES